MHVNLTPVKKITTINKLHIGFRSGEIITLSSRFCVAIKTTFACQEAVKQANNRINCHFFDVTSLKKKPFFHQLTSCYRTGLLSIIN